MSAKAGKRPLRSLTAHEKLDAIRRVHDGESKASVARDIGVPESTLRGWCKNEDKISYLSRQSSPDTDESIEHKEKRPKLDDSNLQPFNLSLKSNANGTSTTYSPNSETRYPDYTKNDIDINKTPLNLNIKVETPKSTHMTERERNRAELARLSVELGLNRPEMFLPNLNNTTNNIADLTANIGLLTQWNNLLLQQQHKTPSNNGGVNNKKVTAPADTSSNMVSSSGGGLLQPVLDLDKHKGLLPKDKQSVHDSVWYWLKSQQAILGLNPTTLPNSNGISTSTSTPATTMANNTTANTSLNGVIPDQSSWFWKWYKQFAYGQQQNASIIPDKPILYQQLTKDKDPHNAENLSLNEDVNKEKSSNKPTLNNNNKARSVLDNLLFNNNNNVPVNNQKLGKEDDDSLTQNEALEHGEKFLKWLEACSEPSVTAMQIMQFRSLLNNVKTGADRKNGDLQNKAKVKRK